MPTTLPPPSLRRAPRSTGWFLLSVLPVAGATACGGDDAPVYECSEAFEDRGPELLLELAADEVEVPAPSPNSTPVAVSLFYTVAFDESDAWSRDDAVARLRQIVGNATAILSQCAMHVEVETAQVVALPQRLLNIEGNRVGSFGGHPPEGTENPDRFSYDQNERLTAETRELFAYGKSHSSRNTIDAYTVQHIVYYANQIREFAGGLSYPPNNYHHVDDYPYRNSVLLVPLYGACGDLPSLEPESVALAHELGHMLLNTGGHEGDLDNLMVGGTVLTAQQCERMAANLVALFGEAAVPDPGPPPI